MEIAHALFSASPRDRARSVTDAVQIRRTSGPLAVLLAASTGCAMTVLDTNVVGIVLPTIASDLGARFADIEWVISSYVLCFASLLLPAGAIADRFGRRRVFLGGIVFFGLASLLCGLAGSALTLCGARALQGIGAAFLLAPALAIIGHTFHGDAERNRAWAIWGGMMGLTMALSPIIGGVIAFALGWRWAFFINAPICALLGLAVLLSIEESRDKQAGAPDPAGIFLFATSMFGLTVGLINGQDRGWISVPALAGFGVGICGIAAFVAVERAQPRPMLDLGLFRLPRFFGAVLAMFAYAACAQVMASLLPQFLQTGLGRSPLEAGFAMLPFALAMLLFPYVGRWLGRSMVSYKLLVLGLCVVATGNALTSLGARLDAGPLIAMGMSVLGAGGGLLNGETQKAIMSEIPRDRAGMASGISTTSRFSGILLGFALLSGVLSTVTRVNLAHSASGPIAGFADAVASGDLQAALNGLTTPARALIIAEARVAYAGGFSSALAVAAVGAALAALVVHLLMRRRG
jgi:EmrB/QacA subfamily drug resistance transporter